MVRQFPPTIKSGRCHRKTGIIWGRIFTRFHVSFPPYLQWVIALSITTKRKKKKKKHHCSAPAPGGTNSQLEQGSDNKQMRQQAPPPALHSQPLCLVIINMHHSSSIQEGRIGRLPECASFLNSMWETQLWCGLEFTTYPPYPNTLQIPSQRALSSQKT